MKLKGDIISQKTMNFTTALFGLLKGLACRLAELSILKYKQLELEW